MSEVIKRGYDGDWHQGEPQEAFASDHADTWSGTRGKSMEYVSDEYAKYGEKGKPTLDEIIAMIPEEKRIVLVMDNRKEAKQ